MSDQPLDLRRSMQLVWKHKAIAAIFAVLGILGGAGYLALNPPMLASEALVVLSPSPDAISTQVVIAGSDPVLSGALRGASLGVSLQTLSSRIKVSDLTSNVISITALGDTAARAEVTANAVAGSYVDYLNSGSLPGRAVQARVLGPATVAAPVTPLAIRLLMTSGLGALAGVLIGAIVTLAISRSDRRLSERDEIADSIGAPVLASIPVERPSDTAGWKRLLREYEPGAVGAWRMRRALVHLGLDPEFADGDGRGFSLAVLSLAGDRKALALGPQLAVCAASLGIPTALVIGPHQEAGATATLRAACAGPPLRSSRLQLTVCDHGDPGKLPDTTLTVLVTVVDDKAAQFAGMMRTTTTVLGVSAGAATAEQLARVAASAAADGRHVAGILVADPDPADHTSGRRPQLPQPVRQPAPGRKTDAATETIR